MCDFCEAIGAIPPNASIHEVVRHMRGVHVLILQFSSNMLGWWNGRHVRFRCVCPHGRVGSSPISSTRISYKCDRTWIRVKDMQWNTYRERGEPSTAESAQVPSRAPESYWKNYEINLEREVRGRRFFLKGVYLKCKWLKKKSDDKEIRSYKIIYLPRWWNGRHDGLRSRCRKGVRVQVSSWAP